MVYNILAVEMCSNKINHNTELIDTSLRMCFEYEETSKNPEVKTQENLT